MKSDCFACNPPESIKKLDIKSYRYWILGLHSNQSYLGRTVVVLKRHLEDLFDITKEEQDEMFLITKKYRDVLTHLFQPDLFNYASLGNESAHVHLHIVPRYKREVTFAEFVFKDARWGKNYSGYDKSFTLPEQSLLLIRDAIIAKL